VVRCAAPALFVDWLNAVIYEMATRNVFFRRFGVEIEGTSLAAEIKYEPANIALHAPAVEAKAATYTELSVRKEAEGRGVAECSVDV